MLRHCDKCGIQFKYKYAYQNTKKCFCSDVCYRKFQRKFYDGETKICYRQDSLLQNLQNPGGNFKRFAYRYIYIQSRNKWVEEHRLIMEKHLGHSLKKTDVVHHINKDTLDNRIANLRVYENCLDHLKAHGRAVLDQDYNLDESEIQYVNRIFGIDKIIFIPDRSHIKLKYGVQVIKKGKYNNRINCDGTELQEPYPSYSVNCLQYSPYYLERFIEEFLIFGFINALAIKGENNAAT